MGNSRLIDSIIYSLETNNDFDIPIYICSRNAIIENLDIVIREDVADSNSLYTELQLINKGIDGLGSDIIGYITNNPDLIDNYRLFNKFTKLSFFKELILEKIETINGQVISLKKVDTGGIISLGNTLVVVNERRY